MINSNLTDYISEIDNLRHLVRYQTAPRVSSETVAEHSFFVAAYILKLNDYFTFNLEKALNIGILHDFSETFISDVPHPIKEEFPAVAKALDDAEYNINKQHVSDEFADMLNEFNNLSSPEGIVVNLADILSVITYSKYEIGLGNSKYMKNVYKDAFRRYEEVIKYALPYLKEGVSEEDMINYVKNFIKL